MAGKQDIKAGGAFIELFVKNKVGAGLKAGLSEVRDGAAAVAAVGAAILVPLTAALVHFVQIGGELDDLSRRTGVSAQRLAFWNYAAGQTGSRIEDIERAMKEARKQGFSPQDFDRLAIEISRIPDPLARAARAAELFGAKSGHMLLPLFEQLPDLEARWKKLDLAPTNESVAMADELGDLWNDLKATGSALAIEIGAALAPAAKDLVVLLIPLVRQFRDWVRENPQVVTGIAAVAAAAVVLGSAVASVAAAVAPVVALFGAILAGGEAAAIAGAIVFIVAVVLSLGVAWLKLSGIWDAGIKLIMRGLSPLLGLVKRTFSGITAAIKVGDFGTAWEIVLTGMTIAWHRFAETVLRKIADINRALVSTFGGTLGAMILGSELSISNIADELARGEGLNAELAGKKLSRLSREAAEKGRQQGQGGRPEDYPLPRAGAAVIGSNANAVLRAQQIIGGGRNPVHDTLTKILALDLKLERHLASINKKTKPQKWR
jgi:hypothetical protein